MAYKKLNAGEFRTENAARIFEKYKNPATPTWFDKTRVLVGEVAGPSFNSPALLCSAARDTITQMMRGWEFVPGGRYLYYAGMLVNFYNNCYLLAMEADTREEWSEIVWRAMRCLMVGGGIGIDYSILRPHGTPLVRTGGIASGPIPLMKAIDSMGEAAVQGGGRRAAIYASLNWLHQDIMQFIHMKDWHNQYIGGHSIADLKSQDMSYHAPMEFTNISVNFDDEWINQPRPEEDEIFLEVVRNAIETSEPGFSFNFGSDRYATLRNACTEIVSEDDSDVCNLGSLNLAALDGPDEVRAAAYFAAQFLVAGTVRADLPYEKVAEVREKNRRIGLGLMGVGEWFIQRGLPYGSVTSEFEEVIAAWKEGTREGALQLCHELEISIPVAFNAIAPTGSISMLAGTTSGAEPLYAGAYKRRYRDKTMRLKYEYIVDAGCEAAVEQYGINPDSLDTALSLSLEEGGLERRIGFQAYLQSHTDHAISSTINLPADIGDTDAYVKKAAALITEYAPGLRGLTFYRDGSRYGQPIEAVPWDEAMSKKGVVHEENEICDISGHGGFCSS